MEKTRDAAGKMAPRLQHWDSMEGRMDPWYEQNVDMLERGDPLELSLVELVVVASECSEDESEISDLVDGLIATGRVLVRAAA